MAGSWHRWVGGHYPQEKPNGLICKSQFTIYHLCNQLCNQYRKTIFCVFFHFLNHVWSSWMNYSFSWNGLMFTFTWHRHLCKIFKTDLPANPDMKFPPAECREMATFFFCINHLKLCIATFLRENQNVFRMSKKKIQSLWWRALKFATGRIRSLQVYNIGLELTLAKFWKTISSWIEYVWLSKHFVLQFGFGKLSKRKFLADLSWQKARILCLLVFL